MPSNDTLESQLQSLEKTLKGNDDTHEKKKAVRMAIVKQAMSEMDETEKKEARKAFDGIDDNTDTKKKDSKKSNNDDAKNDDTKKDSKKSNDTMDDTKKKDSKKSNDDDMDKLKNANEQLEKKVASLTASTAYLTAKPLVDKMLSARRSAGMAEEKITKFKGTLYGKSVEQIKERYDEDKDLYRKPLVAVADTVNGNIPFNGIEDDDNFSLTASDDSNYDENKTLEELFE